MSAEQTADLPEWELAAAQLARAINANATRYARIPEVSADERFDDDADFAESLDDRAPCDRVMGALDEKGAFGRFRNTLAKAPSHEQAWHKFRDEADARRARVWLAELGIQPTAKASFTQS